MRKFDYEMMRQQEPESLRRQLIYEVARIFVKDKKTTNHQILEGVYKWAEVFASAYFHASGDVDIQPNWIHRRLVDAINYRFLELGEFKDQVLLNRLNELIPLTRSVVKLHLAPDNESLLRQACLDFDKQLVDGVRSSDSQFVIGVSGGFTIKAFSRTLREIRSSLDWHKEIPDKKKENVVVCSLTAGGIRSSISSLSDTVAANIADELEVRQSGLLGPPLFDGDTGLNDFKKEKEVVEHLNLVKNVNIILTSVGNVHNDSSLTSQIYKIADEDHLNTIKNKYPNLGDILYQCFNGYTGFPIQIFSDNIENKILRVITLYELHKRVEEKKTKCIVIAKGYEKGYHALRGLIVWQMATDIHMDLQCAQGLKERAEKKP